MDRLARSNASGRVLAAFIVSCAALTGPVLAQPIAEPSYRLGPRDQIRLVVLEDASLNLDRRVSANGTIILPMVGEFDVAGTTAQEVETRLKRALERDYLRQATVAVEVIDPKSQPISIHGAVAQPGTLYLTGPWRLSQALSAAGGIDGATQGIVEVRRQAANGLADRIEIDLQALVQEGDETLDLPLLARDMVNVPVARDITVYFLGEIATQGAVNIKGSESATLLTAIARAGGLTERAAARLVIRRARDGSEPIEIVANFKKILAGNAPDIELEDGDLIVVKEAFL